MPSRLLPLALVAAAVAVACVFAAPAGSWSGEELTPEERARQDSFVKRFRRAQQLFGSGRDLEAEEEFRELLEMEPDAAAVHHAMAYVAWHRGRHAEAIEGFQRAAEFAPEDGAIRRDLGMRLLDLGRPADALRHIEAARELLEPDVETLCAHGRILEAVGRGGDAVAAYREAHVLDRDSVDARVLLSRSTVASDAAGALALLEGVPQNWPDVVVARGIALERLGKFGDAAAMHERLSQLALPGAGGIGALRDAAEGLVRCGAAAKAAAVAERWTERDRTGDAPSLRASVCLAIARSGAGDAAGALSALDASPLPNGLAAPVRSHLGLVRVHLLAAAGKRDDARAALEAFEAPEGSFERLAAGFLAGRAPAAELEAAAKKDPARANDVPWLAGLAALLAGRPADADASFRAAAALSKPPGEHPGLLVLAPAR